MILVQTHIGGIVTTLRNSAIVTNHFQTSLIYRQRCA